jgi:hypothetical protein
MGEAVSLSGRDDAMQSARRVGLDMGHTGSLPPEERSTDKFRCMALCACGWAESRTVRSTKERPIALALKDLERAARKHAQETGHVVDLGDIHGDARQITADTPEP